MEDEHCLDTERFGIWSIQVETALIGLGTKYKLSAQVRKR